MEIERHGAFRDQTNVILALSTFFGTETRRDPRCRGSDDGNPVSRPRRGARAVSPVKQPGIRELSPPQVTIARVSGTIGPY